MTGPEARRLTGPHLLGDWTGAALDVAVSGSGDAEIVEWTRQARRLLDEVGWRAETIAVRRFPGGANLAISAPLDSLYAATNLAEEAWTAAALACAGAAPDPVSGERLAQRIARERDPAVIALALAAADRALTFLHDDDGVSIGTGAGSRLWPLDALPSPAELDWTSLHDVPVALVTGSNGKTTTVRLTAAMATAAGHVAGYASTDGVVVGGAVVTPSDFAGPMGARMVLRDRRVTLAVLETARGGILRRGLAVRRASAAAVTNIAEDHFGDFGVASLDDLADAKLVVTRVVPSDGTVVLNADDPVLAERGTSLGRAVTWFSLDPRTGAAAATLADGGRACVLDHGRIVMAADGIEEMIVRADEIPATAGAAARYNIANALAATALALGLRNTRGVAAIPSDAVRRALRAFGSTSADNAGRGNLFEVGGVRILVDYAHNPHGFAALSQLAAALPARRRLVVLGQAGDRTDDAIRGLARAAWELRPDRIILKELAEYRRGREPGEVPRILAEELDRLGAPADARETVGSELDAARRAFEWAREGDLLLLLTHEDRAGVTAFVEELLRDRWTPGKPVRARGASPRAWRDR